MKKNTEEQVRARRDEIMDACRALYETYEYGDITLRMIADTVSISRPSIYNYFETKEEIFLGLLIREYRVWNQALVHLGKEKRDRKQLAADMAEILESRKTMLKLQCLNLYDMEQHSRMDFTVAYKKEFRDAMENIRICLRVSVPEMTDPERDDFVYRFMPYLYGIYPYVYPTERQLKTMSVIHMKHRNTTIQEETVKMILQLLK